MLMTTNSSSSFLGTGCLAIGGTEQQRIAEFARALAADGCELRQALTGRELLACLRAEWMDGLLVVGELPDMDITLFCRLIRHEPEIGRLPIIVFSAVTDPSLIVRMIRAGADDCLPLSIEMPIATARVKSVLRRTAWAQQPRDNAAQPEHAPLIGEEEVEDRMIPLGRLIIRPARYAAYVDGKQIDLTASEFRVLNLLASRPNHIFSRARILNAIHRLSSDANERSIDSHLYSLRRKLGPVAHYVQTMRGIGYRLCPGESSST